MFGTLTPTPGIYYLDPDNDGKVTQTVPATLMVRAVRYLADSIIQIFQPDFEPETHTHKVYTLQPGDWVAAGTLSNPPASYNHGIDFTTANAINQMLGEVILPSVGEGSFVYGYVDSTDPTEPTTNNLTGKHIASGTGALAFINEDGIWWLNSTAPTQDIELTITVADTKGEALINTVLTDTKQAIETLIENGRATVNWKEYNTVTGTAGYEVIKSIDFATHTANKGFVVEEILAGTGIKATATEGSGQGQVTLELNEFAERRIESSVFNLNNSITAVDGVIAYTIFPAGKQSSLGLRAILPILSDDSLYDVVIWAQYRGSGAAISPGLSVDADALPTPDVAGVNPTGPAGFPQALPDVTNGSGTDYFYVEASQTIDATGLSSGTILYSLSANNPSTAIHLLNTGILLRLK
jgi:hypothetical protein